MRIVDRNAWDERTGAAAITRAIIHCIEKARLAKLTSSLKNWGKSQTFLIDPEKLSPMHDWNILYC